MALGIEIEDRGEGCVVVRLKGRLDAETSDKLEQKLTPHIHGAEKKVLLDLAHLEYISSMGLRVMLSVRKTLAKCGGRLVIANTQPPVQKVLDLAEILPKTDIFQSMESADIFLDAIQNKEQLKDMDVDV